MLEKESFFLNKALYCIVFKLKSTEFYNVFAF